MAINEFTLLENAPQAHSVLSWILWGGQAHVDSLCEEKSFAGGALGP